MINTFLKAYQTELIDHIQRIKPDDFEACARLLLEAYRQDKQIFVAGNGGSAAAANHFACDFGKNAVKAPRRRFRMLSLSAGSSAITALGNDIGFSEIFREQLVNLLNPGDLLMLISASGSSPNLVSACEYARERGARIITLTGFGGGKIRTYADAGIVIDLQSYEQIEDIQMVLLHMLTCYVKENQGLLEI